MDGLIGASSAGRSMRPRGETDALDEDKGALQGCILPGAHEPEDTTGEETNASGGAVKDEHHPGGTARTVGRTGDKSAVEGSKKLDGRDGESPVPSPAGAGLAWTTRECVCESTDAPHQQLVDAARSTGIYVLEVERDVSTSDLREYFIEQMSAGKEIAGLLEDRPGITLVGGSLKKSRTHVGELSNQEICGIF